MTSRPARKTVGSSDDRPGGARREADLPDFDVVVVGAGFSGLYMLYRLRDVLGLRVRVFEEHDGVGGTWHLNRYPGARCDTESFVYCYGFSPQLMQEWNWSGKYPRQPELLRYLNHVADRFDLRRDIRLSTGVRSAAWDDERRRWTVETSTGERVSATYFVTAVGLLASAPYTPAVVGAESFGGTIVHTGSWPRDGVDLRGKRVGVVGTGSTGVQSIPVIAAEARHLHVFQRTPQFTIPARHVTYDAHEVEAIKADYDDLFEQARWSLGGFPWQNNGRSALEDTPAQREETFERLWAEGGFKFIWGSYRDLMTDPQANALVSEFARRKIAERIGDPELAATLVPRDHPLGSRRPIIDTEYFETFRRPNVTLVDVRDEPLSRVTQRGVQVGDREIELDVLVFATGFDAVTGPFLRMDIRGRDGQKLAERWRGGPRTNMGFAVAGFPNMFMIAGPGSMFINFAILMEQHVEWIADCIAHARKNGFETVESTTEADEGWAQRLEREVQRTVIASGGDSWWSGTNIPGRPRQVLFYVGSYAKYRSMCDDIARDGYRGYAMS